MDIAGSAMLMDFYNNIDVFIIAFVRFLGFFIILPVFSGQNIPMMAKLGVALGLALIAMTSGTIMIPPYNDNIYAFSILIAQEFFTGFVIGYVVYLLFSVFYFVGQLVDFQIGFSMVSVYDPVGQIQAPITGNLYYLIICVFFIQTGTLNHLIKIMFESFSIVSIGRANIMGNGRLLSYIIQIIIDFFTVGIKIAMPVVGTIIVVDVVLGILVKAVPQMNVFVVGMPLKVLVGLVIVFITVPILKDAYVYVSNEIIKYVMNMLKGMVT